MKKYFPLFLLFISAQAIQSQENILGLWKIDYLVNLLYNHPEDHEEYNLFPVNQADENGYIYEWGNWVAFNEDETFNSYYTAPCGNDCFPSVYGRFKLLEGDRVLLHVDSIIISGFCKSEQFYPKKDIGIFKIFPEKSGLKLIKTGVGSDSTKLSYSRLVDSFSYGGGNAGVLNQLKWVTLKGNTLKDLLEGLSKVSGYDASKVRLLYSKHLSAYKIVLFEYEGKKNVLFYSPYALQFAIYDGPLSLSE